MNEEHNIAENADETVENTGETAECAEKIAEDAEKITEDAVEAAEALSETGESTSEAAQNADGSAGSFGAEDKTPDAVRPAASKGASQKAPANIKKKKGISSTARTVIIVAAVIVVACAVYIMYLNGVFHIPAKDEMTMDDYTTIEIDESYVTITDDDVESSIDSMISAYTTTEDLEEGTVEEGDTITISYVGTIDGEEFDGGTSESSTITVGSSGYIDGFDDGLIDMEVGETKDLDLTFPDDYDSEDLAGQDVVFTVTVLTKEYSDVPDLTDEFVSENSLEYWGEQIDTVEDLEEYAYNYLYEYYLHQAMLEALQEKQHIKSRDEEREEALKAYSLEELEYYAYSYGVEADYLAQLYGYDDADSYAQEEADYYADLIMLYDYICNDLGITFTDEEFEEALEQYIEDNGYSEYYTVEEYKETVGDTWLMMYRGIEFRTDTILEALEDRVVIVESEEETETETETETTAEN